MKSSTNRPVPQYHTLALLVLSLTFFLSSALPNPHKARVLTGIDVLEAENFARLAGKRVGLITNRTGANRNGKSTIDLFLSCPNLKLVALFSPEHGLFSDVEHKVASFVDQRTGLSVFSLYGETQRPTPEMLQGVDTLVFDIQDIGVRFYTYITTMAYAMEEAAKAKVGFMVLDRPNPINGVDVEGPVLDSNHLSFTGYFPLPVRHGLTVGELARLFNEENKLGVNLEVVRMEGWKREYWFDDTDLPWINPSPNIRNLDEATLYPAIGLLESTNLSVGRGTEMPFEVFGAPWIDASRLVRSLNRRKIPGVKFKPLHFSPVADRYKGKRCHGAKITVMDRDRFRPVSCGLEIASVLCSLYPQKFQSEKLLDLVGSEEVVKRIQERRSLQQILEIYQPALHAFLTLRRNYLDY